MVPRTAFPGRIRISKISANRAAGIILLIYALAFAGCAPLPAHREAGVERVDLQHALGAGTARIDIDNPWGDVYIRRSDRREVLVHAVVQRLGRAPAEPDLRLGGGADSAQLRVRFAGAGGDCRRQREEGGRVGRADLTVFLPTDVRLRVRSACDGRIDTDHVIGDLAASTDQGQIRASVSGRAELRSESGVIRAFLEVGSPKPSSVRSSGGVVLTLPPAVRTELDARACAGLSASGFAWTPEALGDGCARAHAVLGEAASRLSVVSDKSFVELRLRGSARQ